MIKKTKTITEITAETSEFFIIRLPRRQVSAWCANCRATVKLLKPEEAASFAGVSTRTIFRLIEANQVHFTETGGGQLFICFDSLSQKGDFKL